MHSRLMLISFSRNFLIFRNKSNITVNVIIAIAYPKYRKYNNE